MAEAVGVVASAIGIAAFGQQLASSIWTIKKFCEDVKDAPEELRDALDQIEDTSGIMTRLGQILDTSPSYGLDDAFQANLQRCRTAVDRISAITHDLDREVKGNRVRGSIRAVLKRKSLEKLLVKLERNKADLLLVHSMYAAVRNAKELEQLYKCVKELRDGQLQMIEYTRTASSQPSTIEEQHEVCRPFHRIDPRKRSDRSRKSKFEIRLWFCQYAWDVAFERASGRWDISLKSFRIITDRQILGLANEGDIKRIQQLLEARQLSIHDQNEYGDTLVSVSIPAVSICIKFSVKSIQEAARWGHTELVKYLIEHGAETSWNHVSSILAVFRTHRQSNT